MNAPLRVITLCAGAIVGLAAQVRSQTTYPERHEWWLQAPDGCSLYVAEFGRGPDTVVVVHGGFGAEHSYLLEAFQGLEKKHHFVFYDQRGSLRSPFEVYKRGGSMACPDSLITVQKHVGDLELLRDRLGVPRLNIVAHSMGAFIAQLYLQEHPANVGRLVLIAPGTAFRSADSDDEKALEKAQQQKVNALFETPAVLAELKKNGLDKGKLTDRQRIDEWRIRFAAVNLFHVDRWQQLRGGMAFFNSRAGSDAARTMPAAWNFIPALRAHAGVTVIAGDHDFVDLGNVIRDRQLAAAPNVRFVTIKNAGHTLWIDTPDSFRRALERALQR